MSYLNIKNITWNLIKKLANLNFSILLLLFIAGISILGTIITQNQSLMYYKLNYPINNEKTLQFTWKIIIFLGLNQIYTTWWFISIIALFFCSLIICTLSRQLPMLKNSRNWKFSQKIQNHPKLHNLQYFNKKSLSNIIYLLNQQKYYTFHKNTSIYAYKGIIGRIAPVFVHISIILTLSGSLIGLFGGFMAQEIIPTSETFHIKNIIHSGLKSHLPKNLTGRVDNFFIEYNDNNSIKQFFSNITLSDNKGHNLINKQISVNKPLRFKGLTFYQTDWKINSLRLKIGPSQNIQKKLNEIQLNNQRVWMCIIPINRQNTITIIIKNLKEKVYIYNTSGNLLKSIDLKEQISLEQINFTIEEIITCTGLQIKTDPGIIIVYTGFLILMLSIITSYISYSQIWVNNKVNNLEITGSTNRGTLHFEEDLTIIQKRYIQNFLKPLK